LRGASASVLVAGAAIAAATIGHGATVSPAGADAELLTLAQRFAEYDVRLLALNFAPDGSHEAAWDAVHPVWWQIADRIIDLPAHTEAGRIAKASILPAMIRDCTDSDAPEIRATLSLLRDMLGPDDPGLLSLDAADAAQAERDANPTPPQPKYELDAELIALCDRLVEIEAQRCIVFDTIADDAAQDLATAPIDQERRQIEARLYEIGDPQTLAGTCAMSRAAIAEAPKQSDGTLMPALDLHTWLARGVVEYHANPVWGPRA
jgi:hypothetical protein